MYSAHVVVHRRQAVLLVVGAALGAWSSAAFGQSATAVAEQEVRELVQQIWTSLRSNGLDRRQQEDELLGLIEAKTDVALISRLALGRHWRRLPPAARGDYQQLFRDVVIRSLARRLTEYADAADDPLDERFQVLTSAPAGKNDVLVRSRVFPRDGGPVDLDWRLRGGDGRPLVIDMIVEGASLLVAQRSEFAAVIERSSIEGLLAELRARAASAGV